MKKEEQETICELGVTPETGVPYEVTRPFYLKICDGPLVALKKGQRVFLELRTGKEMFFSRKVVPIELGKTFEVIVPFQVVKEGKYLYLDRGDIIKLTQEEAIPLLRKQEIKEKRGDRNETQGA